MKRIFYTLAIAFFPFAIAIAQTNSNSICEDGDCSPEVFSIKLNEPRQPATFTKQRTENFKQAWSIFQKIKNTYSQNSAWRAKYNASQLGGKNCLRHYQLESFFANEYLQNADFKSYLDNQQSDNSKYVSNGFQNSRKGLNLKKRMSDNCPEKAKAVEKKEGPTSEDMRQAYRKLGQELGYFDEQGNLIKPIDIPEEEKKAIAAKNQPKLSKKQQVEQLKKRVADLPVGQETKDKIDELAQDLEAAKPRAKKLGDFLKKAIPIAAAFIAPQLPLIANLDKITGFLGNLLNWKPKLPKLGLLDKIKGLFDKGKKLKDMADEVLGKSNKLKKKFDGLGEKVKKVQDGIDDRVKNVTGIKDKLADLQKKKDELVAKLEDKPRKILDELNNEVSDVEQQAKDLVNKAEDELKAKDKLLKELEKLEKEKDELLAEKKKLENEVEDLKEAGDTLQKEADEVGKEVEAAKKEDEKLENMTQDLADLPSDEKLQEALTICEEDLKSLLLQIEPVDKARENINERYKKVADKPKKLFDKIKNLKLFQEKLKIPKVDIPIAEKTLKKVDGLMEKATALGAIAELLTGKKTKLQERIEKMDEKFSNIQDTYENRQEKLENLKGDLVNIISQKTGLKDKFEKAAGNLADLEKSYDEFIKRYNVFEEDSKCIDQKELEEKIEELKKEQEEAEPELEELEKETEKLEKEEVELEEETKEVEKEIEEETEQAEEIKQEEEAIKEEFGQDVKLEPVTAEEWTESFEVEREYWDAVFHPDDEVVDGYKGRWFQVRMKDAEKNVKLLFGPGEYYMDKSDFRDHYGSVIGTFVTEALNGMKKAERGSVKLFVQGSADITGQNTFRGKLDSKYKYDEVTVLPQKDDSDNFSNEPTTKAISATGFTNDDLPDLRGRYLKEMISIYSKKLDPILLEGAVKQKEDREDRNAVIYLFIPESLVEKYEN
ncbi:MAG: hypothetical protein GY705_14395 [Bacteroidetes bacterium]|nr:hypothetical protein [Bacteroidota bacterium]